MESFHPSFDLLLRSIKKVTDIDETSFVESHQLKPHTAIYLNTHKIHTPTLLDFSVDEKVQWTNNGYYIHQRPAFYADPLFYAGAYYVMDSASMFLEYILNALNISKDAIVLDIAAAPGGKSVLLSHYLHETGLLWSNEIHPNRAKILKYNLSKWGKNNFLITNNAPEAFAKKHHVFDLVLCDAPCTGSGLFRKYPEWRQSFSQSLIEQCVTRQKQILKNLFSSIKENSYLIYSTCSFTAEENEEMVAYILAHGFDYVDIPIPKDSGIVKTKYGIRFFPHLTLSEGFFYAILQKKTSHKPFSKNQLLHRKNVASSLSLAKDDSKIPFREYIHTNGYSKFYLFKNTFYLSTSVIESLFDPSFKYLSIGTPIRDEKSFVPAPELALSIYLNEQVSKLPLTKSEAKLYLKKEPLSITAEKQLYLMTYKDLGIGWAKVLENRLNNYFPNEWRILKDIEE